jgi:hypothetical protein
MTMIKLPGFSAEASFSRVNGHFHATTEADTNDGSVCPANLSSIPYYLWPLPCYSKLVCRPKNSPPWIQCSYTGLGFWNSVTGRCE